MVAVRQRGRGQRRRHGTDTAGFRVPAAAAITGFGLFTVDLMVVKSRALLQTDRNVELSVHHVFRSWSFGFFEVVSFLGDPGVWFAAGTLVVVLFFVLKRPPVAALVATAMAGSGILNSIVKLLISRPRPRLFHSPIHVPGLSFPSGHAQESMVLGLAVLFVIAQTHASRPLIVCSAALIAVCIALVGLSRIILGVHYPTDVLGGYALGAGWFSLVVVFFSSLGESELSPVRSRGRPEAAES